MSQPARRYPEKGRIPGDLGVCSHGVSWRAPTCPDCARSMELRRVRVLAVGFGALTVVGALWLLYRLGVFR